jgi:hypothetical protein
MRSLSSSFACTQRRRAPSGQPSVESWARSVVADPARHHATPAEARIVASLLRELEVQR